MLKSLNSFSVRLLESSWRTAGFWTAFFALVLIGWAALFAMSADFAARAPVSLLGPGMALLAPFYSASSGAAVLPFGLEALCLSGPSPGDAAPLALFGMWALMALAMMAPTAVPLLRTYGDLVVGNPERVSPAGFWALLAGFCLVWVGFAVIAALAQSLSSSAGLMTVGGLLGSDWLVAALLALAGLYQFSTLKAACLSRCRSPMAFFLSHWREGLAVCAAHGAAARHGLPRLLLGADGPGLRWWDYEPGVDGRRDGADDRRKAAHGRALCDGATRSGASGELLVRRLDCRDRLTKGNRK